MPSRQEEPHVHSHSQHKGHEAQHESRVREGAVGRGQETQRRAPHQRSAPKVRTTSERAAAGSQQRLLTPSHWKATAAQSPSRHQGDDDWLGCREKGSLTGTAALRHMNGQSAKQGPGRKGGRPDSWAIARLWKESRYASSLGHQQAIYPEIREGQGASRGSGARAWVRASAPLAAQGRFSPSGSSPVSSAGKR